MLVLWVVLGYVCSLFSGTLDGRLGRCDCVGLVTLILPRVIAGPFQVGRVVETVVL